MSILDRPVARLFDPKFGIPSADKDSVPVPLACPKFRAAATRRFVHAKIALAPARWKRVSPQPAKRRLPLGNIHARSGIGKSRQFAAQTLLS